MFWDFWEQLFQNILLIQNHFQAWKTTFWFSRNLMHVGTLNIKHFFNFTKHAVTGFFWLGKPKEMCVHSCHHAAFSVYSHLTTIHPNKLQICCVTFQANINKPGNLAFKARKSLLLGLKSQERLIQMTFSFTWEAMWRKNKGRVAERAKTFGLI